MTAVAREARTVRRACEIRIGTSSFVADACGALWHESERTLLVADLHLEKGSSFARRGLLLPPYDTGATLAALAAAVARYAPLRVVSLGDGFHDPQGAARLAADCRAALRALQAGRDWVWVKGNHDPAAPAGLPGEHVEACEVAGVEARHEPARDLTRKSEIAGHLHPVARILMRGASVRRRCFATDGRRCILPAFGAYAGGLNLLSRAFSGLFDLSRLEAVVMGEDRVHVFGAPALCGAL
jgi:DNA ligase-associated metallophosphoesterase